MVLTYLEVHEVQKLVDLRGEHLDGLLVDLDAVRLLVGLGLRDGARAAPPRVQHHGVTVTLFQHLILKQARIQCQILGPNINVPFVN